MNAVPDILHIAGLTLRSRDQGVILNDLNFAVGKGEKLAVVGPNGSGKSTLLRLLIRDATPDAGLILLEGRPLEAFSPTERARKIAYLAQNDAPDPRLTLEEYVALGRTPYAACADAPRIVDEVIKRPGSSRCASACWARFPAASGNGRRSQGRLRRRRPCFCWMSQPIISIRSPVRRCCRS